MLGDGLGWQLGLVCVLGQVALSLVSSLGLEVASSLARAVPNAALIYICMLNIFLMHKE